MKETLNFPRAKTRREIANELGMSYHTLYRKLKKNGIELPSGLVNPENVKKIYAALGYPLPIKLN